MPDSLPLNRHSVEQAHNAIQQYIHRTPVLTSDTLSALACAHAADRPPAAAGGPPAGPALRLFFKCENFQKVGAFKARGAFHALSRRSDDELRAGVITHSSGMYMHMSWKGEEGMKRKRRGKEESEKRARKRS